jgi:hypothetical protein
LQRGDSMAALTFFEFWLQMERRKHALHEILRLKVSKLIFMLGAMVNKQSCVSQVVRACKECSSRPSSQAAYFQAEQDAGCKMAWQLRLSHRT